MAEPLRSPRPDEATTRERMLDVALAAFAELGYDGASTREIAARARVNRGLIPYYFGSKEALWREAVDRAFAEVRAQLGMVLEAQRAEEPLDRNTFADLIRWLARFAATHPAFNRLMTEEGKRDGPRLRWMIEHHVRPIYDTVVRLAGVPGSSGPLRAPLDPALLYHVVVGATTHLFHQAPEFQQLTGRDPAAPEIVERHAEALIALFLEPEAKGRTQ